MMARRPLFVWFDDSGAGRNLYAAFRRVFELRTADAKGQISVFADSMYRLFVNGRFVEFGPSRFDLREPLYDTHELAPYLRKGRNVIAVQVNAFGERTYKSLASVGGFVAWGEVRDGHKVIPLATPEGWKVRRDLGYDETAPKFSFPLNPIEVYDQSKGLGKWAEARYDDSDWPKAVVLKDQGHWGKPAPRKIPFMDGRKVPPCRVAFVNRIVADEDVYSFRIPFCDSERPEASGYSNFLFAHTHLHAPRDMEVRLGLFWGEHWVNGVFTGKGAQSDVSVLRIDRTVRLNRGWNRFFVKCGAYADTWDFYLAIPKGAGIEVSATREVGSPVLFRISRPLAIAEYEKHVKPVPLPFDDTETFGGLPDVWRDWKRGRTADNPGRETDWTHVQPAVWPQSPYGTAGLSFPRSEFPDGFTVVFDHGNDEMVRPSISLKGVKGATIDAAYSERVRGSKVLQYNNHRTHGADRFVACEDEVEWTTFHPHGYRYVEYTVRNAPGDVVLRAYKGYSANYPVRNVGTFRCSDPVLTRIWEMCRLTQRVDMEDAYIDCPLRERGLYARDAMIQYHNNLACFGDHRLMRHCLDLFIHSMDDRGFMRAVYPIDRPYIIYDFSLDTVVGFREYCRYSGDREFARKAWRPAMKAVRAMEAFRQKCGLLSADREQAPEGIFLSGYGINHSDGGASRAHHDKAGLACNLNALWAGASLAAAELCEIAGERKPAAEMRALAAAVTKAVRGMLWDEARGLYADNEKRRHFSVQGNAAAVLHGIATAKQLKTIRPFLASELEDNFLDKTGPGTGVIADSAYAYYVLEGVYEAGLPGTAEKVMRKCWGWMLDQGATTCFEHFSTANSLCHAWSASPAWFLTREVLGVRYPDPSNPGVVTISPRTESVTWAEGAYPHPRGAIEVRWEKRDGRIAIEAKAPRGAKVIGPDGRPVRSA